MDWTAIVTSVIAMLSALGVAYMGHGVKKNTNASNDAIQERFNTLEEKIARQDERFNALDEKIARQNERFNTIEEKISSQGEKFSTMADMLVDMRHFIRHSTKLLALG